MRLNVIFSAHELSPIQGSECGSAWNIITRLSKYHNLYVVHATNNQKGSNNYSQQINDYLKKHGDVNGIEFLSVGQPMLTRLLAKINYTISHDSSATGSSLLYFAGARLWEYKVYRLIKKLLTTRQVDIIHHFNHISFREPGYLWRLPRPHIWGPMSGFSIVPRPYLKGMPLMERYGNYLRNILGVVQPIIDPRVRKATSKSSIVYYVTADDEKYVKRWSDTSEQLLDMGSEYNPESSVSKNHLSGKTLQVLWVGRLDYLKALEILLNSIQKSEALRNHVHLNILGDGPQKEVYQKMAIDMNVKNITWYGSVSKEDVKLRMSLCDVFVHTSIKEAGSAVVLEALSCGLPVVCHDAFGMSYSINSFCGIKVPMKSKEHSINGFKHALENLVQNPKMIQTMRVAATQRAGELTWDAMAQRISVDYLKVYKESIVDDSRKNP